MKTPASLLFCAVFCLGGLASANASETHRDPCFAHKIVHHLHRIEHNVHHGAHRIEHHVHHGVHKIINHII